jgi:threonine dehydrogenase-like Zn-dependent dehydrogenase
MRALCWHGKGDVRVDTVPDPKIQHPRDAVIKITACAICGSDLHLLDGYQPTMESGDILGHENMGEVVELGSEVTNLKIGDRVVVPFTISCGQCWFCQKGLFSCCDRTNPNAEMAAKAMGQSPAGLFGFSHMLGGYSGGQAEYLRVPMAKTGQTHVQAYTKPLLKLIEGGKIDPSFVVTHPASLEDAPAMYKKFRDKEDGVIKVVLRPGR